MNTIITLVVSFCMSTQPHICKDVTFDSYKSIVQCFGDANKQTSLWEQQNQGWERALIRCQHTGG
jgi:hypothetical protein